jgi:hypothetical protein
MNLGSINRQLRCGARLRCRKLNVQKEGGAIGRGTSMGVSRVGDTICREVNKISGTTFVQDVERPPT